LPARRHTERTGQPAFADASRSGEKDVLGGVNPIAFQQRREKRPIKAARGLPCDLFGRGLAAQLCKVQPCAETAILAKGRCAFEQRPLPFAMGQAFSFGARAEFSEGFFHALQAKDFEVLEGGMSKHGGSQS
jgi:hypothetical protein